MIDFLPKIGLEVKYPLDAVAVYGAVVATASVIFSSIKIWQDRARVTVSPQRGMLLLGCPGFDEDVKHLAIHVFNKGRRIVAIGNVGLQMIDGSAFIVADSINARQEKIISEQKPRIDFYVREEYVDFDKALYIQVFDEVGREYRYYFTKFPTFKKWIYWLVKKRSFKK